MKKALKVILIAALGCVIICAALYAVFYFAWTTKLQELRTRDRKHTAELVRIDGIDRIYIVRVDGQRVYFSPDFAPRPDIPYRETLTWDSTGTIVILEVAGRRLFAYDTSRARRLSDGELLALPPPPTPELWEYGFASEWPGIGRAWRPERSTQEAPK